MESRPQNPEFKNNPENFHPCKEPADLDPYCFPCSLRIHVMVINGAFFQTQAFSR